MRHLCTHNYSHKKLTSAVQSLLVKMRKFAWGMTACDLDVVAKSTERGMRGDALRTWDNKFAGTGKSQTCKGKEEFKVTTARAGKVLSWEVLKSCLRITACLEAGFGYWYVGAVVTFTTLTGGTNCTGSKAW